MKVVNLKVLCSNKRVLGIILKNSILFFYFLHNIKMKSFENKCREV
jgi:hypothetical protein